MERVARAPRRRARLLLVLAALAGLFLMHGLSDHGMTQPVATEASSLGLDPAAGATDPAGPAAVAGVGTDDRGQAHAGHSDDHSDGHSSQGHGGSHLMMVGMCLALLAAALCLLPVLRSVVVGRRIRTWRLRPQSWAARSAYRPPDLLALGVCRC